MPGRPEEADTLDAPSAFDAHARKPADAPKPAHPTADTITADGPTLIAGRYRVLELLGSGGMGSVYKAHDTELDEVVALKILRRERVGNEAALERFRRELKLARRVTHPGVARAFDIGEHAGERFLTMEYVDGPSLAARLCAQGPLPPAEAARVTRSVCDALAAAHAAGVVHRDLKPDNVLLARDGRVVLTDFGIARALAADEGGARATQAGAFLGTPAYMAPEQVEGAEVGPRADLYALGVALFEMLSGELPFEGTTPIALAAARLIHPPRDLRALRPGLPAKLYDLVAALLARAPAARPARADDVARALYAVVEDLARPGAPAAAAAPPKPPPRVGEREPRLAVMPLRTREGGDDAWIARGLAEDLVDALCTVRGLRVRALRAGESPGEDARAFGRREEVDLVLEGTVRRQGGGLRVSLRLVSVDDGFQLWAKRFDAAVGELLGVSDEAARAVAEALAGAEAAGAPRAAPTSEAVELYLRARQLENSIGDAAEAIGLLERALELAPDDPTILSAYAARAAQAHFYPGMGERVVERGQLAAERAMAIAPHLPEPWLARARLQFNRDDPAGAVRSLLAGRRHGPSVPEFDDLLGRIILEADRLDDARRHLERALWINGSLHFARLDLGRIAIMQQRWAEVDAQLEALAAHSPGHGGLFAARLAVWAPGRGSIPPALIEAAPAPTRPMMDAMLRVAEGKSLRPEDIATHDELVRRVPKVSRPARLFWQIRAEAHGAMGEVDPAAAALTSAVAAGLGDLAWLRHCPVLACVRDTPAYAAALAEVEARARPVREAYDAG